MTEPAQSDLTADEMVLLRRLTAGGFRMLPVGDDHGGPAMLHFVRAYEDGTADAVSVLDQTNVQAVRVNPRGEPVWKVTDTLRVVLDAVLELPHPSSRQAPTLVLPGALPPDFWLPPTARN